MTVTALTCRGCGKPLQYRGYGRPRSTCDACRPDWYPPLVNEVPRGQSVPLPGFAPTPSPPRARRGDPPTAIAAARSLTPGRLEKLILGVFQHPARTEGLTDDELVARMPDHYGPSVRTARSRLSHAGFLYDTGERRLSRRGRQQIVWRFR